MTSDWVEQTLTALDLDEKLSLIAGENVWHTVAIDRLGIPAMRLLDGPNGVRSADPNHGPTSTSFPVGAAMGATWDPELIEEVGAALGRETKAKGGHVLLGPTVNIPRVPNAGRNFECFSEDPVLSGTMAAAFVQGLQGEQVAACIKHFVCNDQETDRFKVDAVVDERTLREVYLEPFRIAIDRSSPWALMSGYNRLNGCTCSEHPILDEVLRDEYGFDGVIVSDWYGTYGAGVAGSGLDLEMPGPGRWLDAGVFRAAIERGEATEADLDDKVRRILELVERTRATDRAVTETALDGPPERALVRRAAAEAMVLMKNDGLLPLPQGVKIAVIGELADDTPHQGGGSSQIPAHRVVSVLDGLVDAAGHDSIVGFEPGVSIRRNPPVLDPASIVGEGFVFEYFDNLDLSGEPARVTTSDRTFWPYFGTRDPWVDFRGFSMRVTGRFRAVKSGLHRFGFGAIGRLRVTVDGSSVVDAWEGADQAHEWDASLSSGDEVEIVAEFATLDNEVLERTAVEDGDRWRYLAFTCVLPAPAPDLARAEVLAAEADAAVVVVGRTHEWEAEGWDRADLRLPGGQDDLIEAVARVQPNTIVVVTAGSPVEMPWLGEVAAVVHAWFPGQEAGHAIADVLTGAVDPGGRLPVVFPATSVQHPGLLNFPGLDGEVRYGEGVLVGQRAYDRLGLEPLFPFGHGMSYASFEVGDAEVQSDGGEGFVVAVPVRNVGDRPGTEVVQVYALGLSGVPRRLVGYRKVRLGVGEATIVEVAVPSDLLRTWDSSRSEWIGTEAPSLEIRASDAGQTVDIPL